MNLDTIQQAMQLVLLDPRVWLIMVAAAAYGIFIGAIPGLTATMAMALLVPVTYWLPPTEALAAIVTMVACAIFSGDIPATLLRIPGTPASAAYTEIAFGFTKRGKGDLALGVSLISSVIGGLFGAVVLIVVGQSLARAAAWFSVSEYFWLYLLGLSCAVAVSESSRVRAALAVMIGLLISTVGLSAVHTEARFTFGRPELYQGVDFISAMIGLFGLSEVLKNLLAVDLGEPTSQLDDGVLESRPRGWQWVRETVWVPLGIMIRSPISVIRSGLIGTFVGFLPGAGADIASWVALAASKRSRGSRQAIDDEGGLAGLCDAGNANNAALAGAWIPALVFGIPGDSVTAIVLGVLLMKDIKPGPEIFEKQGVTVASLYLIFLLANFLLLPMGLLAIRLGKAVVMVPRRVLMPIIVLACVVGSYAVNGSAFDVGIMLVFGLFGFFLERFRIPVGPIVLGLVLGSGLEERFLQTLGAHGGSLLGFVSRPLSAMLALGWLVLVGWTVFDARRSVRSASNPSS